VTTRCDVLILGAGAVGLSTGIALLQERPQLKVVIAEKEINLGFHASGRNSGVLHAGFYYSPDSLKAKFCREGNTELRLLASKYNIEVRNVGKVVVARNQEELSRLATLYQRGIANGVNLELLKESELKKLEPLAVTHEEFLWSPTTGVSDPKAIIQAMRQEFLKLGGQIAFNKRITLNFRNNEVFDSTNSYVSKFFINAAGAQADRISRSIGVGVEYAMIPFMGVYRATDEKNLPLQRLVYPVPHPVNPFLGVHFTLTIDHKVKIGPTAIPILGREQYSILKGLSLEDFTQTLTGMVSLIRGRAHNFGSIMKTEWPKVFQSFLIEESTGLVPTAKLVQEWHRKPPGIRAQLVDLREGKLEQDFVVQNYANSTHILNAVSPGWTSSLPFGRWIARESVLPNLN
jgi:L-2-hydroxyglutarate oxidase